MKKKINFETGEIIETTLYYNNPRNYSQRALVPQKVQHKDKDKGTITRMVNQYAEINDTISKTVPNQALSVREVMNRYASGIPITNVMTPSYETTNEEQPPTELMSIAKWSQMDYAEREAYTDEVMTKKAQIEKTMKLNAEKAIKNRRTQEVMQEVENELKRREQAKNASGDKPVS